MVRKTLLGATQKKLCARTSVVFISLTLIFPACTTIPTQNQADRVAYDPCADLKAAENAGLLVGALLGAVIGKQFSKSKNAVPIGLLIGGSIGAEIGKATM